MRKYTNKSSYKKQIDSLFNYEGCVTNDFIVTDNHVQVTLSSRKRHIICPSCKKKCTHIHSTYIRRLQDLSFSGKRTVLEFHLHKYYCDNPSCARKIVTESIPCEQRYTRLTTRLSEYIRRLSLSTSSCVCSANLGLLNISCSPSTCVRILSRNRCHATSPPVAVGIDDFAYKKGVSYGTVIADLYSHNVIDILDSRSAPAVTEWLNKHPTVQYVSRDGGLNYKRGIEESDGCITQIRDRFHILKDLLEYVEKAVKRLLGSYKCDLRDICLDKDEVYREMWRHMFSSSAPGVRTKYERYVIFNEMKSKGYGMKEIACRLGVSVSNVHRYQHMLLRQNLRQEQIPVYRHLPDIAKAISENKLKNERDICEMYPDIPKETLRGLDRRIEGLRMKASKKIRYKERLKIPSSREIFKVFFVRGYETQHKYFDKILKNNSAFRKAIQMCMDFRDIMNNGPFTYPLKIWIKNALRLNIRELNDFVNMISLDMEAVINAIDMPFSNGLMEGCVNKIKVIKRIMYGRASFNTIKMKITLLNLHLK